MDIETENKPYIKPEKISAKLGSNLYDTTKIQTFKNWLTSLL